MNDPALSVIQVPTLAEAVSVIPPIGVACCVLLDLALPDADEFEGLREIRRFAPHVPTIALTGSEGDLACFRAISAGAQKYLVKGRFTSGFLRRSIRSAIEQKNSEVLDRASRGVAMLDIGGSYVSADPTHARILGRTPEELIGRPWHLGIAEPDQEPVRQAIARASNVGAQRIKARGTRADGSVFDAELEIIANVGAAGAVEGWHYFLRDGSRRTSAQEEAHGGSVPVELPPRQEPEPDLVAALRAGQLSLVYQPIVSTVDRSFVACEALVRWRHPFRGDISPEEFIPTAERTGAITALGEWVLSEACGQLAEWSRHAGRMTDLAMWVNVSAKQLDDPKFSDRVRSILAAEGVEGSRLSLELTETALVDLHGRVAGRNLEQLRELGLRIILDDFGSGYSSLSYVCRLPISGIKLDRSFVAQLRDDHSVIPIVDAVAAMARSLSVPLVAEGIETEQQLDTVIELGCELAQGYMIARPMLAGEVCEWGLSRSGEPAAGSNLHARQATVGIGEAAHDLCVSASTIRRWADCGRLTSTRTPGGHRRILTADVRSEVRRLSPEVKLNTTSAPSTPAPAVADLLDAQGEAIIAAAANDVYASRTSGWFGSMNSQAARRRWVSALGEACRTGTYPEAIRASLALFLQADQEGTTLLERHLLVGRVRLRLVHLLRAARADDTEVVTIVRLMQAIEHAALEAS